MKKDNVLLDKARILSNEPYSVQIFRDQTTTGEPIFLVVHPELPGCMAQGKTIKEALEDLKDATETYILSLLEDRIDVPKPIAETTITTMNVSQDYQDDYNAGGPNFLEQLGNVVRPVARQKMGEVAVIVQHSGTKLIEENSGTWPDRFCADYI